MLGRAAEREAAGPGNGSSSISSWDTSSLSIKSTRARSGKERCPRAAKCGESLSQFTRSRAVKKNFCPQKHTDHHAFLQSCPSYPRAPPLPIFLPSRTRARL